VPDYLYLGPEQRFAVDVRDHISAWAAQPWLPLTVPEPPKLPLFVTPAELRAAGPGFEVRIPGMDLDDD
jgi:hypothetical protein